ncbi:Uu.00g018370.m01.CDS01 [Anthostomella pinea]|uniref:Uu.00g018370.m01.CDS01 n=1 Tax=Anthostomella pinea TaxID=933095 RepID=A0AAI8VZ32_9PEZI|nr:Uu.00g018370.m01.CDS01 [Anthostomella pinea]
MPPRHSLRAFLQEARSVLKAPARRPNPLTFVVGNESADLDSLCSALLFAYFRTHATQKLTCIPLCNLPRADLALRPEFEAVLSAAHVRPDDVITRDELPDSNNLRPEDTEWLLVDHNAMTGELARVYGDRIVGCIDHHDDEKTVGANADIRVVEKSGSCTSLVMVHCADIWHTLSTQTGDGSNGEGNPEARRRLDAELAHLALAPILIDTTNLGDVHKTTKYDEDAVAIAEAKINRDTGSSRRSSTSASRFDRTTFFKKIAHMKEDISQMTILDIFRKDYKEWVEGAATGEGSKALKLGTASVPQSFAYLVDKVGGDAATFADGVTRFGTLQGVDLMVVLTTSTMDGFSRELLLWGGTDQGVSAAKAFADAQAEKLKLSCYRDGMLDFDEGILGWMRCWTQGAVDNSRKQIAPMLRDALREQANESAKG